MFYLSHYSDIRWRVKNLKRVPQQQENPFHFKRRRLKREKWRNIAQKAIEGETIKWYGLRGTGVEEWPSSADKLDLNSFIVKQSLAASFELWRDHIVKRVGRMARNTYSRLRHIWSPRTNFRFSVYLPRYGSQFLKEINSTSLLARFRINWTEYTRLYLHVKYVYTFLERVLVILIKVEIKVLQLCVYVLGSILKD